MTIWWVGALCQVRHWACDDEGNFEIQTAHNGSTLPFSPWRHHLKSTHVRRMSVLFESSKFMENLEAKTWCRSSRSSIWSIHWHNVPRFWRCINIPRAAPTVFFSISTASGITKEARRSIRCLFCSDTLKIIQPRWMLYHGAQYTFSFCKRGARNPLKNLG